MTVFFYTHNFGNPHTLDHQGHLLDRGPLDGDAIALDIWRGTDGELHTSASLLPLADYPAAPDVAALVASYRDRLSERLSPPIATLETAFDTLRENVRTGENAFGNFVADALRAHLEADAVLINSGAIRGNRRYEAGSQISRGDIQRELPFGNRTTLLELKGSDLLSALEQGINCALVSDGCALQVSNLVVTFDSGAPAGSRIRSVTLAGKAINANQFYRVGVSDFMAAGNDGFYMLTNAAHIATRHTNRAMWDLVAERAESLGSIAPRREGRLNDLNTAAVND